MKEMLASLSAFPATSLKACAGHSSSGPSAVWSSLVLMSSATAVLNSSFMIWLTTSAREGTNAEVRAQRWYGRQTPRERVLEFIHEIWQFWACNQNRKAELQLMRDPILNDFYLHSVMMMWWSLLDNGSELKDGKNSWALRKWRQTGSLSLRVGRESPSDDSAPHSSPQPLLLCSYGKKDKCWLVLLIVIVAIVYAWKRRFSLHLGNVSLPSWGFKWA